MKKIVALFIASTLGWIASGENLLRTDEWSVGSGNVGMFSSNGNAAENIREWGGTPDGSRGLLWVAKPDANSNDDGGWNSEYFAIDHSKMYRFSVWIRKTGSNDGSTYLGTWSQPVPLTSLAGVADTNPYFWYGDLPVLDRWYLLVGFIHGSGDASTTSYGGIYDGITGEKVIATSDFKFQPAATEALHRSYLYYDQTTTDRQYFYAPRVDLVDGTEPSIESLLGPAGSAGAWTAAGDGGATISGKVGIGTGSPSNKLDVNGTIRGKEVIVESAWADHVFAEGYRLPSLAEVNEHIGLHGRLPGVPSAEEVAARGVSIGESQAMLLQKIEELTLYALEKDRRVAALESALAERTDDLEALSRRLEELENRVGSNR